MDNQEFIERNQYSASVRPLFREYFKGKLYKDTRIFDDSMLLAFDQYEKHKISQINIWSSGDGIFSIETIYDAKGKKISSGKLTGTDEPIFFKSKEEFHLGPEEYIIEFGGHVEGWIRRLYFLTNKGNKREYGGPKGTPFAFIAPFGTHFGDLAIGIGGHVHFIEMRTLPLPGSLGVHPGLNLGALPPPVPAGFVQSNPSGYPQFH
eukprot:TRINITY_DN48_c0_g2_i1.p1 TRINITY_DN48_c0_g2~~TRINITY_DN48_c0_g2_i1.p1  ORF type:complete len:206 (+),score=43.62 TRINITY_DN48_c0_g2_i1:99-716(+)